MNFIIFCKKFYLLISVISIISDLDVFKLKAELISFLQ